MKRRALLNALPAVASLPAVVAVPAVAATESPLLDLYHRWQAIKDEYNRLPDDADDEPVYDKMIELEREAAAFKPQTVEDFAFKIIFADDNGDMRMNTAQGALAEMAYQIVGIPVSRRARIAA